MRSENDTPVEERYLCLQGVVSARALTHVALGLPASKPENTETFFVGFSYADLPIGKEFQVLFLRNCFEKAVVATSKVTAVTQQWGKPFTEVPHGWKTICHILFPSGLPELVKQLPAVDDWYNNNEWICLCNEGTWQAINLNGGIR